MSEEKTVGEVYDDRNAAVLALARLTLHYRRDVFGKGSPVGSWLAWWRPDDGDDADADEWAVVYVQLPPGQVSWHVPRELVEDSRIPRADDAPEWDGHDRREKNRRLRAFAGVE